MMIIQCHDATDVGEGVIASVVSHNSTGYGPYCAAWTVRGTAPLPVDYETDVNGTNVNVTLSGLADVFGAAVPGASVSKMLYSELCASFKT